MIKVEKIHYKLTHKKFQYLNWISYQESKKGVYKGTNTFEEEYQNSKVLLQYYHNKVLLQYYQNTLLLQYYHNILLLQYCHNTTVLLQY